MSRHTEKQFTNDATTPMIVSVAACIDDNGIVRDLPLEQYLDFMRDCRTFAEKCMP